MGYAWNSCQIQLLSTDEVRDGRYGPVFYATKATGELVTAELLDESRDPDALQNLLSAIDTKQEDPVHPQPVPYFGHQLKDDDKVYIITDFVAGGTLRQFVKENGVVSQPLARTLLRQIGLGLEHLQKQGLTAAFLDSRSILMSKSGAAVIEAPILPVTVGAQPFPTALLSLPEVVLPGHGNMRKADVWLLGVVAAELFTGNSELAANLSSRVASQIKQTKGPAWHLWVPQNVANELDEHALNFLDRCFTM